MNRIGKLIGIFLLTNFLILITLYLVLNNTLIASVGITINIVCMLIYIMIFSVMDNLKKRICPIENELNNIDNTIIKEFNNNLGDNDNL